MAEQEFHTIYPDEYEEAHLAAMGALAGWCYGKGQQPPYLTEILLEAYRHATAEVFNAGVRTGRKAAVR